MTGRRGRRPAQEWFDALDERGMAHLMVAFHILEETIRTRRPPGLRTAKVHGSKGSLLELRITPPGGAPPHLRLFYRREAQTIWVATGFTKQSNRLRPGDIAAGDSITKEWMEVKDQR
jgi:hypothetical protein